MSIQLKDLKDHKFINIVNDIYPDVLRLEAEGILAGADHTVVMSENFDHYFVRNLLKKVENVTIPGINPVEVAYANFDVFLRNEGDRVIRTKHILENVHLSPMLASVVRYVQWYWGKLFSNFAIGQIVPRYTFGATASLPRGSSIFARVRDSSGVGIILDKTISEKAVDPKSGQPIHTLRSMGYETLLSNFPYMGQDRSITVVICDVSKYAKEARLIGEQPTYLMALQNGVFDYLEPILKNHTGIDIRSAQDLHKALAMEASLTGEMATMDQSNASNNILRILIEHLMILCPDLFEFLDTISPRDIKVQGVNKKTMMMATQGNGYIFPLQTLLFYSLIKGIQEYRGVDHNIHVYGDDVICHHTLFEDVEKVFGALGLVINYDKSFKDGPFRESCGGDFLYGINIRPYYVNRLPEGKHEHIDWIRIVNGIRRVGYYNNDGAWRSSDLRTLWFRCILAIPKDKRLFCPRHYGDAGINTENDRLYQFARPREHDAEGKRYPNKGRSHCGKHYFGSEYIFIYQERRSGVKSTYLDEIRGIKSDIVIRLASEPSLKGSGRRFSKDGEPYYPKFFGGTHDMYVRERVAYTLTGTPPEDLDDLFELVNSSQGDRYWSHLVVDRYERKLTNARFRLTDALQSLVDKRSVVVSEALEMLAAIR